MRIRFVINDLHNLSAGILKKIISWMIQTIL